MTPSGSGFLFAKTDSLGDQLLATGLVDALAALRRGLVIWCVRPGYETIGQILPGSLIFRPDPRHAPTAEAQRLREAAARQIGPWNTVVLLPVPFNGYRPWSEQGQTPAQLTWWLALACALEVETAIAGAVNLNWLDQALVLASAASCRVAASPHESCVAIPPEVPVVLKAAGAPDAFTAAVTHDVERHESDNLAALFGAATGMDGPAAPPSTLDISHWPVQGSRPRRILVAPGAGDRERTPPVTVLADAVAALARPISGETDIRLICGPADQLACAKLSTALEERKMPAGLADFRHPDLPRLAALLAECDLLICLDTFIVHLASVVGTPAVAIYGGANRRRFHPRQGRVSIVQMSVACAGCEWDCRFDRRRCLTDVTADVIVAAARERLADPAAPGKVIEPPSTIDPSEAISALSRLRERREAGMGEICRRLDPWPRSVAGKLLDGAWRYLGQAIRRVRPAAKLDGARRSQSLEREEAP